ncbi:MAG: alpha/beta fold hydrolase [Hyphomicrobiaceae bacterium]
MLERLLVTNVKGLDLTNLTEAAATRARTAKLYPKTALVFVHGFGTTFEFALARAAQISRDIGYDGPAFSFTWPSLGRTDPLAYSPDEQAAKASVDSFVTLLATIAGISGVEKIHIVAHSMGNQILLKALRKIQSELPASGSGLSRKIGEIVFAAPDVAQSEFQSQTASLTGHKMTLYASAYDKALWVSFLRNDSVRAGTVRFGLLSSGRPAITPGVDSIDISDAGRDYFNANHDVYASNPYVANDLRHLLQSGKRPPHRRSQGVLHEQGQQPEQYWVFSLSGAR